MKKFLLAVDFSNLLKDGQTHMDMRKTGYQGKKFKYATPDLKSVAFVLHVIRHYGPESLAITTQCVDKEQSREVRSFVSAQLAQVHGVRVRVLTTLDDYFTYLERVKITHLVVKYNEARDLEKKIWCIRDTNKVVPFFMIRVCNNLNCFVPTGQFPVSEVSSWESVAKLVAKLPR